MLIIETDDGITKVSTLYGDDWFFDSDKEAQIFIKAWFSDDVRYEDILPKSH